MPDPISAVTGAAVGAAAANAARAATTAAVSSTEAAMTAGSLAGATQGATQQLQQYTFAVQNAAFGNAIFTTGLIEATDQIASFARQIGGLVGETVTLPVTLVRSAEAGRRFLITLYDTAIYAGRTAESLNEINDGLYNLSVRTGFSISALGELNYRLMATSRVGAENVRTLERLADIQRRAFAFPDEKQLSTMLNLYERYPSIIQEIEQGMSDERLEKLIVTMWIQGDTESARFFENLHRRFQGFEGDLDRARLRGIDAYFQWQSMIEREIVEFGTGVAQRHPLIAEAMRALPIVGGIYLYGRRGRGGQVAGAATGAATQAATGATAQAAETGAINIQFVPSIGPGARTRLTTLGPHLLAAGAGIYGGMQEYRKLVEAGVPKTEAIVPSVGAAALNYATAFGMQAAMLALTGGPVSLPLIAATGLLALGGIISTAIGERRAYQARDEQARREAFYRWIEEPERARRIEEARFVGRAGLTGLTREELRGVQRVGWAEYIEAEWTKPMTATERLAFTEKMTKEYETQIHLNKEIARLAMQTAQERLMTGGTEKEITALLEQAQGPVREITAEAEKWYQHYKEIYEIDKSDMQAKRLMLYFEQQLNAARSANLALSREIAEVPIQIAGAAIQADEARIQRLRGLGMLESGLTDIKKDQLKYTEEQIAALEKRLRTGENITGIVESQIKAELEQYRLNRDRLRLEIEVENRYKSQSFILQQQEARLGAIQNIYQTMQMPLNMQLETTVALADVSRRQYENEKVALQEYQERLHAILASDRDLTEEERKQLEELNKTIDSQRTKVTQLFQAYVQGIAYARRTWLEGFTAEFLSGGRRRSAIPAGVAGGELLGSAWYEGAILGSNIGRPTRTWEEMYYPKFGSPAQQRSFVERETRSVLYDIPDAIREGFEGKRFLLQLDPAEHFELEGFVKKVVDDYFYGKQVPGGNR